MQLKNVVGGRVSQGAGRKKQFMIPTPTCPELLRKISSRNTSLKRALYFFDAIRNPSGTGGREASVTLFICRSVGRQLHSVTSGSFVNRDLLLEECSLHHSLLSFSSELLCGGSKEEK